MPFVPVFLPMSLLTALVAVHDTTTPGTQLRTALDAPGLRQQGLPQSPLMDSVAFFLFLDVDMID